MMREDEDEVRDICRLTTQRLTDWSPSVLYHRRVSMDKPSWTEIREYTSAAELNSR